MISTAQRRMLRGERKFEPGLNQIIGDGNFSAKGVAPAGGRQLLQIIRITLNQHRHVQPGHFQCVGYAFFIAEIWQADQHAVNLVGMLSKQVRAFAGVGVSFDTAELRIGFRKLNGFNAQFRKKLGNILARFRDELVRKEIAVAVNDTENRGGFDGVFHELANKEWSVDTESFGGEWMQAVFWVEPLQYHF